MGSTKAEEHEVQPQAEAERGTKPLGSCVRKGFTQPHVGRLECAFGPRVQIRSEHRRNVVVQRRGERPSLSGAAPAGKQPQTPFSGGRIQMQGGYAYPPWRSDRIL